MIQSPRRTAAWKRLAVVASLVCVVAAVALFALQPEQPLAPSSPAAGELASSDSVAQEPDGEGSGADQQSTSELVVVSDDDAFGGADYEAQTVLVDLVDWVSPEEAATLLEEETGYEGLVVGRASGDYVTLALPEGVSVADAVAQLENTSVVGAVQPNFVYRTQGDSNEAAPSSANLMAAPLNDELLAAQADELAVNDPRAADQWAIDAMNLAGAWRIAFDKGAVSDAAEGVKRAIAVIDEGFYTAHEDLGAVVDTYNSYRAAAGETSSDALADVSPIESNSHGTHVAGILGARTNNGVGVAGVSYNAQLQLIKAATDDGYGRGSFTTTSLAAGLEHAMNTASTYNTRVVNISVGGYAGAVSSFDKRMTKAIDDAYAKGMVVVCSAGNKTSGAKFPYENCPSDYATAVSVINVEQTGATSGDAYARNSNANYNMDSSDWAKDVSAPGTSIVSLQKDQGAYGYLSGSSMAAPHVSGVLSLMFAVSPDLTSDEAIDVLYSSTIDLNKESNRAGTTFDSETGFGLVDAKAAVAGAAYGTRIKGDSIVQKGQSIALALSPVSSETPKWSSSNVAVACVNAAGVVTGVKAGVTVISATRADGVVISHTVTVFDPVASGPTQLAVGATGSSSVKSAVGGTWKWSSSDASIVQIDASTGKVKANKAGTAVVTAALSANPSISASYKIEVYVPTVERLYGDIALDTMQAIVKNGWSSSDVVVLATSEGYWDGLTANGVAGFAQAPVVLTDGSSLSWQARVTIARLKPSKIIVCGGKVAIADAVVTAASNAAGTKPQVKRLWGNAADDTACAIYREGDDFLGGTWSTTAFICTDNGYWDALSVAPISYAKHMPIFLTRGSGAALSSATISAMTSGGVKSAYIVGGTSAVDPYVQAQLKSAGIKVVDRIGGADAIATSNRAAQLAVSWGLSADNLGIATSSGYWDALAGAALCGKRNAALVIVDGPKAQTLSGFVKDNKAQVRKAYVFGGAMAVSEETVTALKSLLK